MRLVSLCSLLLFFGLVSCTKEESFEVGAPARGSLQNTAGECLTKIVAGSFIAGNALTDSNYLEVDVDVATTGSYTIKTDTVNGYSFSGSGNFTKAGVNRVRLTGSGTPAAAGEDPFTVLFDTSFCFMPVTVLPAGSSSGPAVFTLQGSGDSCIDATVGGLYAQGVALNGTNTVAIKINATAAGTYSITTNTVNGFSFSRTSTLAATGEQIITLIASGTPTAEGTTVFTVTAGGTTCAFSVNVTTSTTPPPVGTGDYFPLSANSYWTYTDEQGDLEDSTVVTNRGAVTITGRPDIYSLFEFADGDKVAFDTAVYRKSGNDYYTYMPVDQYTVATFDQQQWGDVLFLKQGLQTGATWTTPEFSGTQNNTPLKIRYTFQYEDANATETFNGVTFTNVYKIKCKPEISLGGTPFVNAGEEIDFYYAKDVGLIYQRGAVSGTTYFESSILHYKVF